MRTTLIFVLALIASACAAMAQAPDTAWTRTLPSNGYNITSVTVSPANSIILVSWNSTKAAWWKWNEFGVPLDSNLSIGYAHPDEYPGVPDTSVVGLWKAVPCIDGTSDCILVGTTTDIDGTVGPYFPFAARVAENGDVVWVRSYTCMPGSTPYFTSSVVPFPDGSAILAGYVTGEPSFAIGVDVDGQANWCRRYSPRQAFAIGTADGALLFGYPTHPDTATVRIDGQGEIVWAKPTRMSHAVAVHPDTFICANAGSTTTVFKMTAAGDTVQTHTYPGLQSYQLIAEPDGGWTMLALGGWFGRFSPSGDLQWSTVYPVTAWAGARMHHADYVFRGSDQITKTESGPRGNPNNLTILPSWPNPGYGLLSWRGAEWQFYQIAGSSSPDGPFDQWIGGTSDTSFVVGTDSAAQFFRVVGVEQLE